MYHGDMLIRFEADNFRSIASETELSMVAVDKDRSEAVPVELLNESLLKVAGVYGPNASGKSNVVAVLAWLQAAVTMSLRYWDEEIPYYPFAFGNGPTQPSAFTLEMTVEGVRFEYNLEINGERILRESLFHYPKKIRRKIFERDGDVLNLQRGLGKLSGTRDLLTPKTLVMSVAPRFDEPLVSLFAQQLRQVQILNTATLGRHRSPYGRLSRSTFSMTQTMRWFEEPSQPNLFDGAPNEDITRTNDRAEALALLRLADLGIEDVRVDEEEVLPSNSSEKRILRRLRLLHKLPGASVPLDFEDESQGTQTWFQLIGPLLQALRTGSLVVFDELDASLHPTLSAALIGIFKRQDTNPRGAQLLFTSHDTSLLQHLNRDEVWLTEKRSDGATHLGSLAEFAGERVRQSVNLESGYLHGK
ncbi:MAG: ATP-binding protein, partial [Bifidobacteriaceae bacterium]|nr:ATP-binding protein [Bifidobacteriaceae bacterium]